MVEEMAQVYREKIKLEAFYKTDIGHALDLTKTRDLVSEALTQLANQIHTQSALEAEGRIEDGETPCGNQELHETELAYNKALKDLADYHRSKVIE